MSLNGGWRCIKIVEPTPSRAQEISGGIKNALDRGEPLEKAKRTFINSGYTPQEVQEAVRLMGPQPVRPLNPAQPIPTQPAAALPAKTISKKTIIIMSVIGAVIIITALVLGFFWDKIF